ncbi:Sestrin-like protein [Dinothrombium tinctorium]|uniref:Sestrin-like protein n=1 Tax=Dinothrombium tinctorium TaxID=1965070 RepID=A0A443QSW7_9ACAR|nr:Sestrin-like protein [Dinothrombium tinctorium]
MLLPQTPQAKDSAEMGQIDDNSAAARHRCSYLVNMEKQEFLMSGGNKEWLKGFKFIPKKLQNLNTINKLLSHQPWLLNKGHIENLTKGNDSWSLSEVVHAIVILSHFHALSSFVFGCGINDADFDDHKFSSNGHNCEKPVDGSSQTPPSPPPPESAEVRVEELMHRMRTISEHRINDDGSKEDLVKEFESVEIVNVDLGNGFTEDDKNKVDFLKFVEDSDFCYVDFARRKECSAIPTFRIQDYSWDDHGFSLVNRLYSDIGNLLDAKFKTTYDLTYNTMGRKTNVDTKLFRRALWVYIQSLYGIRHDDYDYREVNLLVPRDLKGYIKTVCCFPHRVPKSGCDDVMPGFRRSEKVSQPSSSTASYFTRSSFQIHVNLMISEARMQAELLYALRSVMNYMK